MYVCNGYDGPMTQARTLPRWNQPALDDDDAMQAMVSQLMTELNLPPLVARLLARRGIQAGEQARQFLDPRLSDLHDPMLLPDMEKAAGRLVKAIADGQSIVIYGDYDVDGITASSILYHVLTLAGAQVETYVPHRIEEGYGLNCEAIASLCDTLTSGPDGGVIVSVDCGVTACEPALVARSRGVDLIITDHHHFNPDQMPEAYAIVHPGLPGSKYPFTELCGAGVALKLAWAFARLHCGSSRVPEVFRKLLVEMVSLAALGTVADVVPLVGENRVIASVGLKRIKQTSIAGLNALIDATSLRDEKVDAYHVGFVLGPRLNACGRMGHAKQAVHLLTRASTAEAMELANFLTQENTRRQETEREMAEQAKQMVREMGQDRPDHRAIVVADPQWHLGVAGIVASRLVDTFHRPAIVLCIDEEGHAHGSARSVDGVSIHEALEHCREYLDRFGGHSMAAGMHLTAKRIDDFRQALVAFVNQKLSAEDLTPKLEIEACCSTSDLDMHSVEQIERLAPFGRENPKPVLALNGLRICQPPKLMGQAGKHLSLVLTDGYNTLRAVGFGMGEQADYLASGSIVDVACEVKVSWWQGQGKVELMLKSLRRVK